DAPGERKREQSLRIDRSGIERQRALEMVDRFRKPLGRRSLGAVKGGASSQDVIKRVGMVGWSRGFGADQFEIKRDSDLARHLVLQGEQIVCGIVETIGPDLDVGLRVDQLRVDTHPTARAADAT